LTELTNRSSSEVALAYLSDQRRDKIAEKLKERVKTIKI